MLAQASRAVSFIAARDAAPSIALLDTGQMDADVFRLSHHGQIVGFVIADIAVDVMHDLARKQCTAKLLLGNDSVHVATMILDVGLPFAASS